jgi:hypothetical protein
MMLGFDVDYAELMALSELFKKITLKDYLLLCKSEEVSQEAYFLGKKLGAEIGNSIPLAETDLEDDLFEDGFISVSLLLSNSEAAAFSKFVRVVKINDVEIILLDKKMSKEANNGLWVIKEALQRWGTNLDLPHLN